MKIVKVTCPNCGGNLSIDGEKTKEYCEYCGTPIILDKETQNIQLEDAEDIGYKFEKGRIRAQEEKIIEEREARARREQEAKREKEERALKRQQMADSMEKSSSKSIKKPIFIFLITISLLILIACMLVFCCIGMNIFTIGASTSSNGSSTAPSIKNEKPVVSLDELDDNFINQLKSEADNVVSNYVKEHSLDVTDYKDILEQGDYIGYSFANDDVLGNEIFFIYRLNNKTESIDNVNLRTFSDNRDVYYYVGFKNIKKNADGTITYDTDIIDEPIEKVADFSAKKTYTNVMYSFEHAGYPFISLMFDDLEQRYSTVEYEPDKASMINSVHKDKVYINNYSDNTLHCAPVWFDDGYTDESGEYYTECMYAYNHFAFTDPICLDYRIGSEYSKLTFTTGTWPGKYNANASVFIRVIDKDSFDVIYESESMTADHSISHEIDVTGHKNIRIQFIQVDKGVDYSLIKDVCLSD